MADYGTTLLATRIQAGIAWTAHDIYYFDGDQFMRWGMWQYRDKKWALRPWSQALGLLIRDGPRGSSRAPVSGTPPKTPALGPCRCAALVHPDGGWNLFLVNRGAGDVAAEVVLPGPPKADFAVYRFDQKTWEQNQERIDLSPVGTLPGAQRLNVTLPPRSLTVLVEKWGAGRPVRGAQKMIESGSRRRIRSVRGCLPTPPPLVGAVNEAGGLTRSNHANPTPPGSSGLVKQALASGWRHNLIHHLDELGGV
jgi:hypothetical protein